MRNLGLNQYIVVTKVVGYDDSYNNIIKMFTTELGYSYPNTIQITDKFYLDNKACTISADYVMGIDYVLYNILELLEIDTITNSYELMYPPNNFSLDVKSDDNNLLKKLYNKLTKGGIGNVRASSSNFPFTTNTKQLCIYNDAAHCLGSADIINLPQVIKDYPIIAYAIRDYTITKNVHNDFALQKTVFIKSTCKFEVTRSVYDDDSIVLINDNRYSFSEYVNYSKYTKAPDTCYIVHDDAKQLEQKLKELGYTCYNEGSNDNAVYVDNVERAVYGAMASYSQGVYDLDSFYKFYKTETKTEPIVNGISSFKVGDTVYRKANIVTGDANVINFDYRLESAIPVFKIAEITKSALRSKAGDGNGCSTNDVYLMNNDPMAIRVVVVDMTAKLKRQLSYHLGGKVDDLTNIVVNFESDDPFYVFGDADASQELAYPLDNNYKTCLVTSDYFVEHYLVRISNFTNGKRNKGNKHLVPEAITENVTNDVTNVDYINDTIDTDCDICYKIPPPMKMHVHNDVKQSKTDNINLQVFDVPDL